MDMQRLCMLLVDGGRQALRYTISRIVLHVKLQNIDEPTREELCENDRNLLYSTGLVLPLLDGLTQAGLNAVWTKALQKNAVPSGITQHMIYDYLVGDGLDIQLKNNKQRVQELNKENKILSQEQWDTLYPRLNVTVDLKSFDITLLCFVIMNVFQFKPTSGIWNQDPLAGDVCVGDDIVRLRKHRNTLVHSFSFGMDSITFQTAWTEIRDVLVRLKPDKKFSDEIQQFHDCQKDPEKAAINEQLIVDWKLYDRRLEELESGLKRNRKEITKTKKSVKKRRKHAGKHYEDNRQNIMLATVNTWRRENIYMTKCVAVTQEKIRTQNCVCVIGVPGAGKSTAIHHAALSLENEGFVVHLIHGPKDFLKLFDKDKNQVFIMDDVLGVYSLEKSKIDLWDEHNDDIRNSLCTNTKLLVSIRTQLFNQAVKGNEFVFLDKSTCIDFCDETYRLATSDMMGMLTHYLTVQCVDNIDALVRQIYFPSYSAKEIQDMTEKDKQSIMSWNTVGLEFSNCFPLLCKVFCSESFVRKNPREFFINPFQALTKIFEKIKSDNTLQFCGLVLCTVFDGKLTEDLLSINCEDNDESDVNLCNVIMKIFQLEGRILQVKSALTSLDGVYVKHIEKTFTMAHAVFHDVVTYLFNNTQPLFVLKYGKSEFIRDRIRLMKTQLVDDPYMILIDDDKNIERLADRLFRDFKSDTSTGGRYLAENPNIADDRLISCLRKKLSDRGLADKKMINDLFYQFIRALAYIGDSYKHGDVTQYKLIELCVQTEVVDQELIDELFVQSMETLWCNSDTYKHACVTQYKLIELCIHSGADCNMEIRYGVYPIHISVETDSLQLTKFLLHKGADTRRVDWNGDSILHYVCRYTEYNKLELFKLFTQHLGDQSVVRFIKNDRHDILQELQVEHDNLQLEKVLPDNSVEVLTTDKHEMKHLIDQYKGPLQLVERVHDNILTYIDNEGRNILHYLTEDAKTTSYVLTLPGINNAVNQRDKDGRTPCWYIVNNKKPLFDGGAEDVVVEDKEGMIKLYKANHAILCESDGEEKLEVIYKQKTEKV